MVLRLERNKLKLQRATLATEGEITLPALPAQPHPPLQPGVSFTSSQPRAAQFLAVHARLLGAERVRRGAACLGRLTASAEDAPLPPRGSLAQARRASAVRDRTIHRRSSALCYARARAPRWSAREATNRALSPRRARCA